MKTTRREMLALLAAMTPLPAGAGTAAARRKKPEGFLWGAAISAHQSEGNDVNSDSWLLENLPATVYREPSGDACDSLPIVTYNHFTVPRWFAMRGGWEMPDSPDLFGRFCERATRALGDQIGMASPFNEANIYLLIRILRKAATPEYIARRTTMAAAAARATDSPKFSSLLFADPDRIDAHMLEAHAKAYQAIKAGPGDFPVGVTLTTQAVEGVGEGNLADEFESMLYGKWWDAVNASDFIGVQAYTRFRVDSKGLMAAPQGAELTAAGYEYYPQALGLTVRLAARKTNKPIYVTESGIGTDDDTRRIAWLDASIAEVARCLADGIDIKSYIYWSLLDNFEWTQGYGQHFGLIAVDRSTSVRTPKPSAHHFAQLIGDRK
jgi:beta-glucosidase